MPHEPGHIIGAFKSKEEDGADRPIWEGAEVRSKVKVGGGEHAVKQFINIKVKSSKEEVTVHAKNELVSVPCLIHVCTWSFDYCMLH